MTKGEAMERVFLTAEEAAEALRISRSKVYDLIRNGDLASTKIGRLRRVPVDAVQEFARQLIAAGEDAA